MCHAEEKEDLIVSQSNKKIGIIVSWNAAMGYKMILRVIMLFLNVKIILMVRDQRMKNQKHFLAC